MKECLLPEVLSYLKNTTISEQLIVRLSVTTNYNDWPKPPFCIQQFSSRCLFKLTSASPLTNSCLKQKWTMSDQRSLFLCPFLPAFICMRIFTLRGFTWLSAWRYVTICIMSSPGVAMFFPVEKINLTHRAYALMFALRWVAIFIPIFTTSYFQKRSLLMVLFKGLQIELHLGRIGIYRGQFQFLCNMIATQMCNWMHPLCWSQRVEYHTQIFLCKECLWLPCRISTYRHRQKLSIRDT